MYCSNMYITLTNKLYFDNLCLSRKDLEKKVLNYMLSKKTKYSATVLFTYLIGIFISSI